MQGMADTRGMADTAATQDTAETPGTAAERQRTVVTNRATHRSPS